MGFLDFLFGTKQKEEKAEESTNVNIEALESIADVFERDRIETKADYFGKGFEFRNKAREAVKEKNLDEAWGLYHKAKEAFLIYYNGNPELHGNGLSLEASIHEELANICRLEKRHNDALFHILYWITGVSEKLKKHDSKLKSREFKPQVQFL